MKGQGNLAQKFTLLSEGFNVQNLCKTQQSILYKLEDGIAK